MCPLSQVCTRPLLGFFLGVLQRRADAQLLQLIHQVSVLVHLEQDVAASHELAVEVDLRDCGPVGEDLDSCGRPMKLESHYYLSYYPLVLLPKVTYLINNVFFFVIFLEDLNNWDHTQIDGCQYVNNEKAQSINNSQDLMVIFILNMCFHV